MFVYTLKGQSTCTIGNLFIKQNPKRKQCLWAVNQSQKTCMSEKIHNIKKGRSEQNKGLMNLKRGNRKSNKKKTKNNNIALKV